MFWDSFFYSALINFFFLIDVISFLVFHLFILVTNQFNLHQFQEQSFSQSLNQLNASGRCNVFNFKKSTFQYLPGIIDNLCSCMTKKRKQFRSNDQNQLDKNYRTSNQIESNIINYILADFTTFQKIEKKIFKQVDSLKSFRFNYFGIVLVLFLKLLSQQYQRSQNSINQIREHNRAQNKIIAVQCHTQPIPSTTRNSPLAPRHPNPTHSLLQPYLLRIHATVINHLKKKCLERELTGQEQSLLQSFRNDSEHMSQLLSALLAIDTCVTQLAHEHLDMLLSFLKATNLLILNFNFLYNDYLSNHIKTTESLQVQQPSKGPGFLKFFDSLKFLALVIKNSFICPQSINQAQHHSPQEQCNSIIMQNLKYEMSKLQDLMQFEGKIQDQQSLAKLKQIDEKMITLHNEQSETIISQLQKQNNFLKWQIYSKENTITEYEESIYNLDLSRYRKNQEREEYWARRVKFTSQNNSNPHKYSNQRYHQNTQHHHFTQHDYQENRILQPSSELLYNQQLSDHLSLLSKRMEELQLQNSSLKAQLKQQLNHPQQISSSHELDSLFSEFQLMKSSILQLQRKELITLELLQQKHEELQSKQLRIDQLEQNASKLQQNLSKLKASLQDLNLANLQSKQALQSKEAVISRLNGQIQSMNEDFIQEMQKYNTVFYKISEELSSALEKIDSLTLSNHALTSDLHLLNQKNKKLQQENLRKQTFLVDLQTKLACSNFSITSQKLQRSAQRPQRSAQQPQRAQQNHEKHPQRHQRRVSKFDESDTNSLNKALSRKSLTKIAKSSQQQGKSNQKHNQEKVPSPRKVSQAYNTSRQKSPNFAAQSPRKSSRVQNNTKPLTPRKKGTMLKIQRNKVYKQVVDQSDQRESPNSNNPGNKLLVRVQNVRGEKENSANNVKIKGYSPNKKRT